MAPLVLRARGHQVSGLSAPPARWHPSFSEGKKREKRGGRKRPLPWQRSGATGRAEPGPGGGGLSSVVPAPHLLTPWRSPPGPFPAAAGMRVGLAVTVGVRREGQKSGGSWYSWTSPEHEEKIFVSFFACESDALFKAVLSLARG